MKSNKIKWCLVIVINITLAISFWLILEYRTYKVFLNDYVKSFEPERRANLPKPKFFSYKAGFNRLSRIDECKKGSRLPAGLEFNKKPIILFGCSFTEGVGLNDNEVFSYKLSHYAKRPVYNYGFGGKGIQHMLYILQKNAIYENIKEPPEYVIYTFLSDHIYRLYAYTFLPVFDAGFYLNYYENNKGELKETKWCSRLCGSYILKSFLKKKTNSHLTYSKRDENFDFMKKHFIESKKTLNEKYPNTKFVILKFVGEKKHSAASRSWYIKTNRWDELKDEGFIVISVDELVGRDLDQPQDYIPFDYHPSSTAWDLLVPELAEKLNL